jgi:uncharacterized repeat protein (TIGR02543 family)
MNRKKISTGVAAALTLLFFSCEMMGPKSGTGPEPDGKATVRIGIGVSGVQGRSALPSVVLADTAWELWGGQSSETEAPLENFSSTSATVYLETGTWDFTLKGYRSDDLILQGNITGQNITLEGPNDLSFTVAPIVEGDGSLKITINLPAGHSITGAKVFKDGDEIDNMLTPSENAIVFEADYPAGDYYFSIRLYNDNTLYGVVSELAQVRMNLSSEKTYALDLEDLNVLYAISYQLNGGLFGGGVGNPGYYRSTDATFALPAPTFTGYTFGGWYDNTYLTGSAVTMIPQGSTENQDLYAKWTIITYDINYNLNGGTNGANPATYTIAGLPINLAEPNRLGYRFDGWYNNEGFYGSPVAAIPANSTGDKTFYAKWTIITYDIDYNLDGGTNGANPATYTIAELPINLAAPNRLGYTFEGWHDNESFDGSPVAAIPANSTGEKIFYARWTAVIYTVTYDKNADSASGTMEPSSHAYDQAKSLVGNSFSRTGYAFAGWNTLAVGGGTSYNDNQSVENLSSADGATVPLYAQWTAITYTVAYNANGGTGNTAQSSHTYDQAKSLTGNSFSRDGYAFAGWNTQADGNGTSYSDNQSVENLSPTDGATVPLYAQWWPHVSINISVWANDDGNILVSGNNVTISKGGAGGFNRSFAATVESAFSNIQWYLNGSPIPGTPGTARTITVNAKDYDTRTYTLGVTAIKDGVSYSTDLRFTVAN